MSADADAQCGADYGSRSSTRPTAAMGIGIGSGRQADLCVIWARLMALATKPSVCRYAA
jgi:hypothetical protein